MNALIHQLNLRRVTIHSRDLNAVIKRWFGAQADPSFMISKNTTTTPHMFQVLAHDPVECMSYYNARVPEALCSGIVHR